MNAKRMIHTMAAAGLTLGVTVSLAPSAAAGDGEPLNDRGDIEWTWNSSDHNARGAFQSYGEKVWGRDYDGNGMIQYRTPKHGQQQWWVPGSSGAKKTLNLSIPEYDDFDIMVCQIWNNWPDDCSPWLDGAA